MTIRFNEGESKTFQIQAERYEAYPRHWVGREYKPCSGTGCALCAAGVSARTDYKLPITIAGVSEDWIFSKGVAEQLDTLTQQGVKLLGLTVNVTRTGRGKDTRYTVTKVSGEPAPTVLPSGESIKNAGGKQ